MARTRTTIRRIDPWSILKFGFVANLVLLGVQLLAGTVLWYVIQRLELIQTVCELAATVGFEECGVDGGALFDTVLVLGLLGVVIQTGILVFLTFLANLIFDLTGGIVLTLEDDRGTGAGNGRSRSGVGARSGGAAAAGTGAASFSGASARGTSGGDSHGGSRPTGDGATPVPPLGTDASSSETTTSNASSSSTSTSGEPSPGGQDSDNAAAGSGSSRDDDTLFGSS